MNLNYKVFHFQELDWTVTFPPSGNHGKYSGYNVTLRKGNDQAENCVRLIDVVESPEFEQAYPHTVGYFKLPNTEAVSHKCGYLELRRIRTIEEFWLFLNSVDL